MGKVYSGKHTAFIFLALHTAIVVLLSFLVYRSQLLAASPLWAVAFVAVLAAATLYTAHAITRSIESETAYRAQEMARLTTQLQENLRRLDGVAKELEAQNRGLDERSQSLDKRQREIEVNERDIEEGASLMSLCQMALEHRADTLNRYSGRIDELLCEIEATDKSYEWHHNDDRPQSPF